MSRKALVIGNKDYVSVPRLRNSLNDAQAIKQILELKAFFLTYYENLGFSDFLRAIRAFGESLTSQDFAFFYYAGHALQIMDLNYLLPIDVPGDLRRIEAAERETVYLGDIIEALSKTSGPKIIILDACRTNDFQDKLLIYNDLFNRGLSAVKSEHNMLICYSTQPGNTSGDGEPGSDHGCFTGELIKYLRQYGLSINDAISKTREAVLKKTNYQQIPWESNSLSSNLSLDHIGFPGHLLHEFPVKSSGVDTIACSEARVFIGTEERVLFVFHDVCGLVPFSDLSGEVEKYEGEYPLILSYRLPNKDFINEATFYNEDIMIGVSENGFVYQFSLPQMLSLPGSFGGSYTSIPYNPDILYEPSCETEASFYSVCLNSGKSKMFVSDSNGFLIEMDVLLGPNSSLQVNCTNRFRASPQPITCVRVNSATGGLYFSDGASIRKVDFPSHRSVVVSREIQAEHFLYHSDLGFIIASNDDYITLMKDDDTVIKTAISPERIALSSEEQRNTIYKTSMDILEGRYVALGTNKPSVILFDTLSNELVDELFLDLHLLDPYSSAIYGLAIYLDKFLICRSRLHYIGIWKIKKANEDEGV